MLRIAESAQLTDTGRQREANEDSLYMGPRLFAVADGMGGAQAGEVASHLAVEAFGDAEVDSNSPEEFLRQTVRNANRRIFELAQGDASRSGMGTTLTAALVHGDEISFAHVGDSRAYVYRDGDLKQVTNDHSLVEELRRQGRLTRDQAAEHPQRSVITRALGPEPDVQVDTFTYQGRPGDLFLLCSDGLTTMLSDEDLLAILRREADLERMARRLIRAANDRGGRDNITVVLFRLEAAEAGQPVAAEGATLVGAAATEEGFTADAVRSGSARERASRRPGTGAPPPRRPRRPGQPVAREEPRRSWPRTLLKTLVALVVIAAIGVGAVIGARQIWFLGVDGSEQVAVYRGLPYELPFGINLYSEQESTGVDLNALPEERRGVAVDHELRSEDDARSLASDLQTAAAVQPTSSGPGDTNTSPQGAVPGGTGPGAKQDTARGSSG
jgi:protein phosphatase